MANQFPFASQEQRAIAKQLGAKTYQSATPCKHCGSVEKYVSSMGCVNCNVERNKAKLYDNELMDKYRGTAQWTEKRLRGTCKERGITVEEYNMMFEAQQGVCKICGRPDPLGRLAIDHDHTTNKVRGLLCRACNLALGNFGDSVERLERAIAYLKSGSAEC